MPKSRPLVSADLQSLQKGKQKVQGAPLTGNDWSIEVLIGESFFSNICLISIHNSVFDGAAKISVLNTEKYTVHIPLFFVRS